MTVADLLYSKVYAQQQNNPPQTIETITPKPATPIQTATPTPIILQARWETHESCGNKYWSIYNKLSSDWCICEVNNWKKENCSSLSQETLNTLLCTTPKYSERVITTAWKGSCVCTNGPAKNADGTPKNECLINKAGSVGIKCTAQDLINNTCSRNINKTLGIRSSDTTPNPTLLLQDIVLGATSFVGTIIMVALVYLGFKAILKWTDDADALWDIKSKAKNLIIWFLLVIGSYTIIRLVQYIARGF